MSDKQNTTWADAKRQKAFRKAEFNRRFMKYHIVYIALFGTGALSMVTGFLLPFSTEGELGFSAWLAAAYFAFGFVTNGEIAANFWFEKLTDHDKDNGKQFAIAVFSLGASVIVSLVTALAASVLIAYWLGIFPAFTGIPDWAQVYIVDVIPVMWIYHAVAGFAFKGLSDEAEAERTAKAIIREKEIELIERKEQAKVDWWEQNAVSMYEEQGRKEAREHLERKFNKPSLVPANSETKAQELAESHPTKAERGS